MRPAMHCVRSLSHTTRACARDESREKLQKESCRILNLDVFAPKNGEDRVSIDFFVASPHLILRHGKGHVANEQRDSPLPLMLCHYVAMHLAIVLVHGVLGDFGIGLKSYQVRLELSFAHTCARHPDAQDLSKSAESCRQIASCRSDLQTWEQRE